MLLFFTALQHPCSSMITTLSSHLIAYSLQWIETAPPVEKILLQMKNRREKHHLLLLSLYCIENILNIFWFFWHLDIWNNFNALMIFFRPLTFNIKWADSGYFIPKKLNSVWCLTRIRKYVQNTTSDSKFSWFNNKIFSSKI